MSKFTEGRLGVPGTVNGVIHMVNQAGHRDVFCFGPFGVGVVIDYVSLRLTCLAGTGILVDHALALVRTGDETEENFAAGMGLVQGGGIELMGQRAYRYLYNSRGAGVLTVSPQVEIRESQVWLAVGFQTDGFSTWSGWVNVRTLWPGAYGGDRPVEIREREGD